MPNIKAILFDLDGTLNLHLPTSVDVFTGYVRQLGYKISDEAQVRAEHWTHFYFANSSEIRADSEKYKEENAFWLNFTKRWLVALGLPVTEAVEVAPQASAHMAEQHKPVSFVPQEAFPVLESLKSAGYMLGVVSNREKPYGEKLKEMQLDSYFKFALASAEVNSYKPDKVIFERALELAGTSAAETLYVGDNYFADVVGARRAGITPVLYDPRGLFFDPGCAVLANFAELPDLLK